MADMTRSRSRVETAPSRPARSVQFRGGGFVALRRPWAAPLMFVLVVGFWQACSSAGLVSPIFLPSPVAIGRALVDLWTSGEMAEHMGISLFRILTGWILGTIAGLAFGVAVGIFNIARAAGLPLVSALFPIPKIALLPLLILWLGIGEISKVATIGLGVFFPTVIAAYAAVDSVPRNLIRMAQSFGLPPRAILTSVILPGALPGILSGFRITASIALMLVVSAEMIGARMGIGAFVLGAGNLMQTDQLLAGVLMLSLLGLSIGWGLSRLEAWLLRWR